MWREVKSYFEDIASDFDSYYERPKGILDKIINVWLRRRHLIKRLKITLDLSNPTLGKKILDVGCGSGKFIVECAKRDAEVYGIDISKEMIEIAKKFCEKNNAKVELEVGDAAKELPSGFDVCVALGVFEYFEDPKPILRNMFASVNKGGIIIFSVPSLYAFQTPLRKILLYYRKVKSYHYTKKRVFSLLDTYNEDIKKIDFNSYGPGLVVSIEKR